MSFSKKKFSLSRPRGTQDFFFSRSFLWSWIQKKTTFILEKNCFSLIIFPTFESKELFLSSREQVNFLGEMYTFFDRKRRELALRPEGTLSTARLVLQNSLYKENVPLKLYYLANMFRYERPQEGRYREFWQLGGEIVGSLGLQTDLQIVNLVFILLSNLQVKSFTFSFNYLGSKETQNKYEEKLRFFLVDKRKSLCFLCQQRWEKNILRILDCDFCRKKFNFPLYSEVLSSEDQEYILLFKKWLFFLKIPFIFDVFLVRGLDYYTGLIFEVFVDDNWKKAIVAGGRYDCLYQQLSTISLPSVGFSLGVDRLIDFFLEKKDFVDQFKPTIDVFFLTFSSSAYESVFQWKKELEILGFFLEYNLSISQEKKKEEQKVIKVYNPRVLIVIEEDLFFLGEVFWKTKNRIKTKVKKEDLIEKIKNFLFE